MEKIEKASDLFENMAKANAERTKISSGEGPHGNVSRVVRSALKNMVKALKRRQSMHAKLLITSSFDSHLAMKSMTTLDVENWFPHFRKKWPMPSSHQFATLRAQAIVERAKQSGGGSKFSYHLGGQRRDQHYVDTGAELVAPVQRKKKRPRPLSKQQAASNAAELRDLGMAASWLRGTRTQVPKDNAKERMGAMPLLLGMQAAPALTDGSEAAAEMDSNSLSRVNNMAERYFF